MSRASEFSRRELAAIRERALTDTGGPVLASADRLFLLELVHDLEATPITPPGIDPETGMRYAPKDDPLT